MNIKKLFFLLCIGGIILAAASYYLFYYNADNTASKPIKDNVPEKILLVPMDDRPVNIDYPLLLAEKGVIEVSQSLYADSLQERIAIIIKEVSTNSYSSMILSFDNLLYGGLLESRAVESPLEESEEEEIIEMLKQVKEKGVRIEAFTSSQRVAPSVLDEKDLEKYQAAFHLNINLTSTFFKSNLTSAFQLSDYEKQYYTYRANKLNDTAFLISSVTNYVDALYIGQDDTQSSGIQKYELHFLKGLSDSSKLHFLNGTDEIIATLVWKILDENHNQKSLRLFLTDEKNKNSTLDFEGKSIVQLLKEKEVLYNFKISDNTSDDLWIINNGDSFDKEKIIKLFEKNERIILVDLNTSINEKQLLKFILEEKPEFLSKIITYSAWNTPSNAIGLGLTQYFLMEQNTSNAMLFEKRILKDYFYKTILKPELEEKFPETLAKPYNINNPDINAYAVKRMNEFILQNLSDDYIVTEVGFPWKRFFEAEIKLTKNKRS